MFEYYSYEIFLIECSVVKVMNIFMVFKIRVVWIYNVNSGAWKNDFLSLSSLEIYAF